MGISVLINTLNEEGRIKACIDSLRWADEIVVVDMFSDDSTADVASQMGCKVFSHQRMGFVEPARQFGIDQTTHDWVLILDADEMVSVETPRRLREIADGGVFSAVLLPRKNYWNGQFLKCCGWYPDAQLRFLKKSQTRFPKLIHHQPEVAGEVLCLPSSGPCYLVHDAVSSWSSRFEKLARYGRFSADAMDQKGRKVGIYGIFTRTILSFLLNFLVKGGVFRGQMGLFLSMERAFATFVKYVCLWEIRSHNGRA
jgi:glycosyltransferase involved in cell wall biosynthesis